MDACERWEEQISALLDGELSQAERLELAEHLAACPACREYLADLTAIREAMGTASAPEGLAQSVMERVRETARPGRKRGGFWRQWGFLAACCVLAALGVWRLHGGGPGVQDAPGGRARGAVTEAQADTAAEAGAAEEAPQPETAAEQTADAPAEEGSLSDAAPNMSVYGVHPSAPSAAPAGEAESAAAPPLTESAEPEEDKSTDGLGIGDTLELVDCETAAELFGHPLIPCTADNFQGYSLGRAGNDRGGDVIYTCVNYQFSNGTVSVRDQDREGRYPIGEDYGSVTCQGETFLVRDAAHGGERLCVLYLPNGETGLAYAASFEAGVSQEEVFALLLSLKTA